VAGRGALIAICVALTGGGVAVARSTEGHSVRPPARCRAAHSRTIAQDAVARVYKYGGGLYGCSARTGIRTRLGSTPYTAQVRLVGSLAAYAVYIHGIDFGSATVVITRLTDGKRLGSASAIDRAFVESFQSVTSLIVRRSGAVAWIASVGSIVNSEMSVEVHRLDRGGRSVLLDRGAKIDPKSLRLRGSTLTWTNAGVTRSSTLP
jgi:hypothetical protein